MMFKLIEDRSWNNEGIIEHFIGTENACFQWILKNTPFSNHEAMTNQGYRLEPIIMEAILDGYGHELPY